MTIWTAISGWMSRTFSIDSGLIGASTDIVAFFLMFMFGIFGGLMLTMGILAYRGKMTDKWLGVFPVAVVSINMLMWNLIQGYPLMSLLGLIGGLIFAAIAVILYRMNLTGVKNNYILLGVGIGAEVLSLAMLWTEIYGGGGLLV